MSGQYKTLITYYILLIKSHLQSYPCPLQINSFWNLGFLLGITIILQIITGIFLGLHYTSDLNSAYSSVFFRQSYLNYFSVKGLKHLSEETGLMHLSTHYEQRYNYKNYLSFISPGQKSKEINWEHMNVKHKLKTEEKGISDYMYLIFRKDKDNQEK